MTDQSLFRATPLKSCFRIAPVAIVAISAFVVFSVLVPRFMTVGNIENVLRIGSILGIVACGQAIAIVLGGIEFSFGASAALASVVIVMALPDYGSLAAFAAGALVVIGIGSTNGVLIARYGVSPVIATLGTLMIGSGSAAWLAGGLPIDAPASEAFSWPARGRVFGISVPIIAAALAFATLHFILAHARIGRLWYLVGANPLAAKLAGLRVARILIGGYACAGVFCALGAIILTSRVGSGQPALAPNLAFETIAACAIGGLPLSGGQGRVVDVVFGVLIIAMLNNVVVLLNLPVAYQLLGMGMLVILAVLLQRNWAIVALVRRFGSVIGKRGKT